MSLTIKEHPVPLAVTPDGVVRIAGTRVPIDTIVYGYHRGETPEQIAEAFDAVPLAAVYSVIGYYLIHKCEIDDYLREREKEAERMRQHVQSQPHNAGLRERLVARRNAAG